MKKTIELIKKVKKLEIKTRNLVDGLLFGAYHSVFKGKGIEFSDVREYAYGDDIKSIDWNVTAKMNHPYVKEFVEERDLTTYIVFDVSGSSSFGYEKEKRDFCNEIAASLVFAAGKNNDNIGLFLFSDHVEKFIPSRKGRRHSFKIFRELVNFKPKNKMTDIAKSLEYVNKVVKKRSILFIISDFDSANFEKQLKILKFKHDIVPINVHDIRESELPDIGYVEIEDPESGEVFLLNTSDKDLMNEYSNLLRKEDDNISDVFKKNKIEQVKIRSDYDFKTPMQIFFKRRMLLVNR